MKTKTFIFITIINFVFLTGCSQKRTDYKTLYLRLPEQPSTLDPALTVDVYSGGILSKIYSTLVKFDENLAILPDAAEKWAISRDGRQYVFYIDENLRFSDGTSVTSRDVKKSFQRILSPGSLSSRKWMFENVMGAVEFIDGKEKDVSGFEIIGEKILGIELIKPFAPFLGLLAMPNAAIVKEGVNSLLGSGAFKLEKWERGEKILLSKNREYLGGDSFLENICYRIIPQDFTAISEFKQGNLDILGLSNSMVDSFKAAEYEKNVYSKIGLNIYYIGFNCQKKPFNNIAVRRALVSTIDKERIIKTILVSRAEPAFSPVPPVLLDVEHYEVEKKVVFPKERALKLLINTSDEMQTIAEVCQHFWKEKGVKVDIIQREWNGFKEALNNGEFDMFILSWWADYPDAENFLYPVFYSGNWGPKGNRARYSNKIFDKVIVEARSELDLNKRENLYRQAVKIVVRDCPWAFLWHKKDYSVIQPWVVNFKIYPLYYSDKGVDVKLEH